MCSRHARCWVVINTARTHTLINVMVNNPKKKSAVHTILKGTAGQAFAMSRRDVSNVGFTSHGQILYV